MYLSFILLATILNVFAQEQVLGQIIDPVKIACSALNIILPEPGLNNVDFLLWTKSNPDNYYKIIAFDKASLDSSNFNGSLLTYFLFHGFEDNGTKKWISDFVGKILPFDNVNVISVNFSALVSSPIFLVPIDYTTAVCNAYKVGNYCAHVANWMSQNSALKGSHLHLIGHSLGAHVAGVMGYYMISLQIGKCSRITGLDPAGPAFSKIFLNGFKLGKDQADCVDIIHTNGCDLCLGINEELGHVDFYPNGGELQPGCPALNETCSHDRVTDLYVESINPINNKTFNSWPCVDYKTFNTSGCPNCGQGCLDMGFHLSNPCSLKGKYYCNTNAESPYAKGNVQK